MKTPKIGDRYKDHISNNIIEIIRDVHKKGGAMYMASVRNVNSGMIMNRYLLDEFDTFLGNYTKDENLTNLYQILYENEI